MSERDIIKKALKRIFGEKNIEERDDYIYLTCGFNSPTFYFNEVGEMEDMIW